MPTRNLGRGIWSIRCYNTLPGEFLHRDLLAFPIGAVIDLTPGEGCLARAAYQLGLRYTGLTFNEAHAAGLRGRLEGCASSDMLQEGHRLYDATFHAAVRRSGIDGSGERNNPGKDPHRRPKKKPRNKKAKDAAASATRTATRGTRTRTRSPPTRDG